MAKKPQKYADGGPVDAQPTMALGYADGGTVGQPSPFAAGLDANTTTFNQDYLRGPSFGSSSTADLVNPPAGGQAPAGLSSSGSHMNQDSPQFSGTPGTMSGFLGSPAASFGASLVAPGLMKLAPGLALAQGAYDMFSGAQGNDTNGSLAGWAGGKLAAGTGGNWSGTGISTDAAKQNNPNYGNEGMRQADVGAPTLGSVAPADIGTPTAAPDLQPQTPTGPTSSFSTIGGIHTMGAADNSNAVQGDRGPGGSSGTTGGTSEADGGQINAQGAQRPSGLQAMNAPQPPGPPGLQMPGVAQPPAPAEQPMHPALAQLHVQNKMANPQVMQAMKAHLNQAIQSGQVNPQQLQIMGQLAQSAIQHPELWPKLRQFAIQAGIPDAQSLPQQFNQGLAMALMAASHASQHGDRPGAFADGGMLHGQGSGTSDSIHAQNHSTGQPVKLSNGEYIIPADVVATKGKEFFDNIVRKYHTPAAMQR